MNSLLWWHIAVSEVGKKTSFWDSLGSVVAAFWFGCLESSVQVALFVWKDSGAQGSFTEEDCSSKLLLEQQWKILRWQCKIEQYQGINLNFVLQTKFSDPVKKGLFLVQVGFGSIYIPIYLPRIPRERRGKKGSLSFSY